LLWDACYSFPFIGWPSSVCGSKLGRNDQYIDHKDGDPATATFVPTIRILETTKSGSTHPFQKHKRNFETTEISVGIFILEFEKGYTVEREL
jgi:hypothetical protein